jgi:hypothetical protein
MKLLGLERGAKKVKQYFHGHRDQRATTIVATITSTRERATSLFRGCLARPETITLIHCDCVAILLGPHRASEVRLTLVRAARKFC